MARNASQGKIMMLMQKLKYIANKINQTFRSKKPADLQQIEMLLYAHTYAVNY